MAPALVERVAELDVLEKALLEAVAGRGSVLLSGEAGIGKSSVLRAFLRAAGGRARLLVGACDDLLSPRALGPLRDIARQTGGALAAALAGADREAIFGAVLDLLSGTPTVCAIEDAHWADEATLDVLRHVGRRVADLPAVLVITYRDDEIGADHLLRPVLGALAAAPVHRLVLPGLSPAAVAGLAHGTGVDAAAVHQLTGGNPFFVSEVLATGGAGVVPDTVVDVVLARLHRLDPPPSGRWSSCPWCRRAPSCRWSGRCCRISPCSPRPSAAACSRWCRAPCGSVVSWPAGPWSAPCR